MSSKKGDYEIGYGKPPEHSRFQKGRSANPAGRPKGKTAPSPITKVLERKVTMTVDGKRGKVAVTEALMTRLVESAFKGDDKALRDVIRIAQQMETAKVRAAAARPPASDDEAAEPVRPRMMVILGFESQVGEALGILEPYPTEYEDDVPPVKFKSWVVEAALARMTPEEIERLEVWRFAQVVTDPSILEPYEPPERFA